jgi:hypothetical protein
MALILTTIVQMLLGLINLGSTSGFLAFVSCGVIGLAAGYAIPVAVSMVEGRKSVSSADFRFPSMVGWAMNGVMVIWVAFQMVLFSMPATLPVTAVSMNYASVVFVGFFVLSVIYYAIWARKGKSPEAIRLQQVLTFSSIRRASEIRSGIETMYHREGRTTCDFATCIVAYLKIT